MGRCLDFYKNPIQYKGVAMEKRKLEYEITECYSNELNGINTLFEKLENGRVYELSRNREDDSLAASTRQLKRMVDELLKKIQGGKAGNAERLEEILKIIRY